MDISSSQRPGARGLLSRLAPRARDRMRQLFHPQSLQRVFTKTQANRGLERYRRIGMAASTSFASKALMILISFVSVPLTVHYLGAERYGVWLTISSLLTWMALTDFGIAGNALVNAISEADGNDDRPAAQRYASSAFWTLLGISGSFGLAAALAFSSIPWRSIFRVSADVSGQELERACALVLILFTLSLPLNMLNSIYSAYQDGFVSNLWNMASNLLALASLVIVTRFHGGLPALILASFGTRALVSVGNAVYLFVWRYPWLRPSPRNVRRAETGRLFRLGSKYLVSQLASLGIYQSQPLLITQLLGPSKVTIFVIAYKIIAIPIDLAYLVTAPLVSAFSEARARGDWPWIRSAFRNTTLACGVAGLPAVVAIGFASKWLTRLLAGAGAVPDWNVVFWLSLYTALGIAMMTTGQLLSGIERVGTLALSLTCCALVTIGLGAWFAHPFGLAGVAAGMAIAKLVTFVPLQGYQVWRLFQPSHTAGRPREQRPEPVGA